MAKISLDALSILKKHMTKFLGINFGRFCKIMALMVNCRNMTLMVNGTGPPPVGVRCRNFGQNFGQFHILWAFSRQNFGKFNIFGRFCDKIMGKFMSFGQVCPLKYSECWTEKSSQHKLKPFFFFFFVGHHLNLDRKTVSM